jgi:outer membrane protein assembly factor BamC
VKHFSTCSLMALTLALGACSSLQSEKIDYKSAGQAPSLAVPPDLTQLSRETRYAVPGGTVTASTFQSTSNNANTLPTALNKLADVRVEREGSQRWLVVNRSAEQLWTPIKDFWQASGFVLSMDQSKLGIMETDWAENRAKIPQDFLRRTLGKVLDSLYSTGERDKFRTRLERNAQGGTDIFISHRGMIEVYSSEDKNRTVWQPRATDPELEAEFLRRLMVKLGASEQQAQAAQQAGVVLEKARIATINGQQVVMLDDGFERAWRRVGLSLDRTSFTVVDRDRAKGLYFVRYVAPQLDKSEPGFFSKLFSNSSKGQSGPEQYRITVVSSLDKSTVSVQNSDGTAAKADDAQRILKVLADDLR